jgi:aspartate/methionine/tyrosine aminotransferase
VDPEGEIIVTVGANEAVLLAMMAFLNPGDEVIIPDPMWLHYFYCASLAGAQVISVPLLAENQFQLDPEDLKKLITPNTKMIVINSPHNPTGSIFRAENIKAIADIVEKHNLLVLSDEIYEKLVYSDTPVISPGSIESISERTLTINGFSKSYAMTGWRLGYIAASKNLIESMIRVHQYTTVCATSFAQAGAIAALRGPQNCVDEMVAEFDRRRQIIVDGFNEIGEDVLVEPAGAFYAFPDIRKLNASSEVVAQRLLDEAGVAVINGKAFGRYGDGYFRISYACSIDDVKSGMNSISDFWQKND